MRGVIRKRCWGRDGRPPGPQTMGSGWNRPAAFPVGNGSVPARPFRGDGEGVVGADLSTSPSLRHQPTPPPQGCASSAPTLGGATTQGLKRGGGEGCGESPEIVPGAAVGASGVSSDGLMRGPQAEDPNLAVTAQAGAEERGGQLHAPIPQLRGGCSPWSREGVGGSPLPAIGDTRGDRHECSLGGSSGREGLFLEGHQVEWPMQKQWQSRLGLNPASA